MNGASQPRFIDIRSLIPKRKACTPDTYSRMKSKYCSELKVYFCTLIHIDHVYECTKNKSDRRVAENQR